MICIDEGAQSGDWCGAPPLVWVELLPLAFWLDLAAAVEALLDGCDTSTSGMSPKVGNFKPSVMVERVYVGGMCLGGGLG
jgi:hypothetical protein